MPTPNPILPEAQRAFVDGARRAVLTTIGPDGRPRPVPICFVLDPGRPIIYTPLDEKPKRVDDVLELTRMRDIAADARVAVLVDRWDEDWTRLAWVRLRGSASRLDPGNADHAAVVHALRGKYEQYRTHDLESRPVIAVVIERVTSWGALTG